MKNSFRRLSLCLHERTNIMLFFVSEETSHLKDNLFDDSCTLYNISTSYLPTRTDKSSCSRTASIQVNWQTMLYGILLESARDGICLGYGNQIWKRIVQELNFEHESFTTLGRYEDNLVEKIAECNCDVFIIVRCSLHYTSE